MATPATTEQVLRSLGVRITRIGPQIRGHCPVHRISTGHEDGHPSWGINAVTGAWLCFSCHESGSLPRLVEILGGDIDGIGSLILGNAVSVALGEAEPSGDAETPLEPSADTYVSAYAFGKNPLPPERIAADRDIDQTTCRDLNIRWDSEGRCWLLPIYAFQGALLGWQEKSTGYFNNFPKGVMKRGALFGFQNLTGTVPIIVVESPLDAARFYHYGYEAVAVFGSFVSDEQVEALSNVDIRQRATVILAFDNDPAGHSAAYWSTKQFLQRGVEVRYFRYPPHRLGLRDDPGDIDTVDLHRGVRLSSPIMPPAIRAIAEGHSTPSPGYRRTPRRKGIVGYR
jgi:hypothetical protein